MAEKDDDFMEGEEAAGGGEAKEGKGKPKFASAFILQILKWVAIVLGGIVFIVTVVFITVNLMGVGQQKTDRVEKSPEYETVVPILGWYSGVTELRGVTNDDPKRTFVVQIVIGYNNEDPTMDGEISERKIQITDMLLTWFSRQQGDYLINIENREEIRETIKAEINHMLEKPISDIRFTTFQVLEY
jgi:flagellar FliL protein